MENVLPRPICDIVYIFPVVLFLPLLLQEWRVRKKEKKERKKEKGEGRSVKGRGAVATKLPFRLRFITGATSSN